MGARQRTTIIEAKQPISRRSSESNTKAILSAIEKGILNPNPEEGNVYLKNGKKITERLNHFGYRACCFHLEGKCYTAYIHKIIWLNVHKKIKAEHELDHIEAPKTNCSIRNIQELHWKKNIQKGQLNKKQIIGAF